MSRRSLSAIKKCDTRVERGRARCRVRAASEVVESLTSGASPQHYRNKWRLSELKIELKFAGLILPSHGVARFSRS